MPLMMHHMMCRTYLMHAVPSASDKLPLWPVLPEGTTLLFVTFICTGCSGDTRLVLHYLDHHELEGITITFIFGSAISVNWYASGSNPSHVEGLGRAGSFGQGEEECSANPGVHSCLQV